MAVGLWISFDGGTQEQYDAVQGHMGVDDDPPEGLIFHSSGPTDAGWNVIDFWETREAFDTFAENRLGPAMDEMGDKGFPGPPSIKMFPVHHITKP